MLAKGLLERLSRRAEIAAPARIPLTRHDAEDHSLCRGPASRAAGFVERDVEAVLDRCRAESFHEMADKLGESFRLRRICGAGYEFAQPVGGQIKIQRGRRARCARLRAKRAGILK